MIESGACSNDQIIVRRTRVDVNVNNSGLIREERRSPLHFLVDLLGGYSRLRRQRVRPHA